MQSSQILLLCILGAALWSSVMANNAMNPDKCCFAFYGRKVAKKNIRSYALTHTECPKVGVILQTQRKYSICADPEVSWVQNIMKAVDERIF